MAKDVITPEWIDALPSQVTGPTQVMASSLVPGLKAALSALNETVAAAEGAGESSPRQAALALWEESGDESFAKLVPLRDKLTQIQNLLVEVQAEYDSVADKGIKPFLADATEKSEQLKIAATNALVERRTALVNLLKVATGGQVKLPGIPGTGKSHQAGESVPRPDLDKAWVDGEEVIPANGQFPVMSDIHRVIAAKTGIQAKVRELSMLIFRTAKTREVPAAGLTVQLTINGKSVEVKMTPRSEADKPVRGRQAK